MFGLLLKDNCPGGNLLAVGKISNFQSDQVTSSQLAIYGEVEQSQPSNIVGQLKSDPYGPDLLKPKRFLLANQLAFIPWRMGFRCLV
jgi:hypothetical protein